MRTARLPDYDRGNAIAASVITADPDAPPYLKAWAAMLQSRLRGVGVVASPGSGQGLRQAGESGASTPKQMQMRF